MEIRFQNSPDETKKMCTEQLRKNFLIYNKDEAYFLGLQHFDKYIAYLKKVVYDNNNL